MELTIPQWLVQSLPESLALAGLALALSGRRLELKSVFFIGLPLAAATFLVRLLPISFGVHTMLLMVMLAALLKVRINIRFSWSLLTALIVYTLLIAAEVAFVSLMYFLTGISFEEAREDLLLWIVTGWPHIIFLFLLALFIERWRKKRSDKREE